MYTTHIPRAAYPVELIGQAMQVDHGSLNTFVTQPLLKLANIPTSQ